MAIVVCGALLAGCGEEKRRREFWNNDVDLAPICSIKAAFVDLANQQVVVDLAIQDPDQLDKGTPMQADLELITATGTFHNDVVSASTGNVKGGNSVFTIDYSLLAPGLVTRIRISPTAPIVLPSDPNSAVRVTVTDKHGICTTCQAGVDLSLLISEPDCHIISPGATSVGTGTIPINLQITDNQGDKAQLNVFYSLDDGATLSLATLTATSAGTLGATARCNPANPGGNGVIDLRILPGGAPRAFTVSWDSRADGVGRTAVADIILEVFTQDCTTASLGGFFKPPCTQATRVSNKE